MVTSPVDRRTVKMINSVRAASDADELTASECYRLLADERRRMTLDVLAGRNDPIDLAELAVGIAAREDGVNDVDESAVTSVAHSLHHVHLPKLSDHGMIEYNSDANRIESCPHRLDGLFSDRE